MAAVVVVGASALLTACGATPGERVDESVAASVVPTTQAPVPTTPAPAVPPPAPTPAVDGDCPYLDASFVEETNGQRVSDVKLSADTPPACFFYRGSGAVQLTVHVVTGVDPAVARALVDQAAPVATSDPATVPGGWDGGKQPTDEGAVFAVAKDGAAVVVTTNQNQTIKASRVAEQAIEALGL